MEPKVKELMDILTSRSENKRLNWVHASEFGLAPKEADDFLLSLSKGAVNVYKTVHEYADDSVCIAVQNDSGQTVLLECAGPEDPFYPAIDRLLTLARGSWLRVDETLEQIKNELRSDSRDKIGALPPASDPDDDIPF